MSYSVVDSDDEVEERCSVVDSDNDSDHVDGDKHSRGESLSCRGTWISCYECMALNIQDTSSVSVFLISISCIRVLHSMEIFFCNPILFAVRTSTFSRLCKKKHIQWHIEECSLALCN
jgi:hypothetical protein